MSVLVAAAGAPDRDALQSLRFSNVTMTNISREPPADLSPYHYETQDLEALQYDDLSFDWALVSASLHHCRSPHRALLELYRVARRGVLALESRDSLAIRIALRFGVIEAYELASVAAEGFDKGGVRDSGIPNYVYRWTEREVEKTIASFAPEVQHQFIYFRALELPLSLYSVDRRRRRVGRALALSQPVLKALTRIAPRQTNLLAFAVVKPSGNSQLQPWLTRDRGRIVADRGWIETHLES